MQEAELAEKGVRLGRGVAKGQGRGGLLSQFSRNPGKARCCLGRGRGWAADSPREAPGPLASPSAPHLGVLGLGVGAGTQRASASRAL